MFEDISKSSNTPLGERDVNTSSVSQSSANPDQTTTMAEKVLAKGNQPEIYAHNYVSPSDNILSPTSKKLSELKGKRYANVKPQSLFAKTVKKESLKSQEKFNAPS